MDINRSQRNRKRKSLIYFSQWVEDHDEGKLSTLQFGAHMRMKQAAARHSKRNGCPPSLPDDDNALSAAAKLRPSSWPNHKAAILSLWELRDDRWHYHTLDDDYAVVSANAARSALNSEQSAPNCEQSPSDPRSTEWVKPLETQEAETHLDYTRIDIERLERGEAPPASDWKFWKDLDRKLRVEKELIHGGVNATERTHSALQKLKAYARGEAEGLGNGGPIIDVTSYPSVPAIKQTTTVFGWASPETLRDPAFDAFQKANAGQKTREEWDAAWRTYKTENV